ncbi:MAG: DUF1553 domain-containing protein [Verrucomicrobia bacterium]|nr:DUF1553 domain-containing protein [Verrucomicrobiota bacterium]
MKAFFFFVLFLALPAWGGEPVAVFETKPGASVPAPTRVDSFISARLKQLGLPAANLCSDAVFLRRVYLDLLGTLPTGQEAQAFLDSPSPTKRAEWIERLLARDEFADYWGMKWCDLLRVKAEFPVNLWPNAAQAYDRWIRTALKQNIPYSQFARELLTANGSNFRVPQVNFYRSAGSREPKAIARAVALTFLGERTDHWPKAKLDGMAIFFSQIGFKATGEWKEEIVSFNGMGGGHEDPVQATFPDGTSVEISPDQDPRELFADWLLTSKNSPFARNAANRVWFWLMGRGIIQEPDDSRPDNPPSNPELLAFLARELVAAHYDLKHLYRLILNSNTYQRSCIPATPKPEGEANFASYPLRRLDAEVLIDAINQITGASDEYSSMIPEPFTWVPVDKRSIALPDGSISSPFLDLFGRPSRDTGLLSERTNRSTAAQRLHLLNSSHIQKKITGSAKLRALIPPGRPPVEGLAPLYLTVLSRYPTEQEVQEANSYASSSEAKGEQAFFDLAWSLINSAEFLYRH